MNHIAALLARLWPTAWWRGAALANFALSLCMLASPLLRVVGYESAAMGGIWLGLSALVLTWQAGRTAVEPVPWHRASGAQAFAEWALSLGRALALLPVMLAPLVGGGAIWGHCDLATGLGFWVLIAAMAVLAGQTLAWSAMVFAQGAGRCALLLALAPVMASLALFLAHLALEPPVVGHHLLFGYFAGSIYDEGLHIPQSLMWYRLWNLAGIGALVAACQWRRMRDEGRAGRWGWLASCAALLCLWGAGWVWRHEAGLDLDRGHIAGELGGRLETEHFVIHYPRHRDFRMRTEALADDHEYRYAELREYLKTDPVALSGRKLHSYVYGSRNEKGRLMGARNTLVAKLWLGEMHILWRGPGDVHLAHEMAHLFSVPYGRGPLSLSARWGVGVNMGVVEGLATAAAWPVNDMDPHDASAAMRELGIAPDLSRLVGASGFWQQSSGLAYTLMGSFTRYLIDTYGIATFWQAYGEGDFEAAYNKAAPELVAEWEAFVDAREVSAERMELARHIFDRPTIFQKVCARRAGHQRRLVAEALEDGHWGEAERLVAGLVALNPRDFDARLAQVDLWMAMDRHDEAHNGLVQCEMLSDSLVDKGIVAQLRADLAWSAGRQEEARLAYGERLQGALPVDLRRGLLVKRLALEREQGSAAAFAHRYLLGEEAPDWSLYPMLSWLGAHPADPVAHYLMGRRLWSDLRCQEALGHLVRAEGQMGDGLLDGEVQRMLGQCRYHEGQWELARAHFERARLSTWPHLAHDANQWLKRIGWREKRPATGSHVKLETASPRAE